MTADGAGRSSTPDEEGGANVASRTARGPGQPGKNEGEGSGLTGFRCLLSPSSPSRSYPTRADVIEHLSWCEDLERGRWGVEYATEVLEHLEAQARNDGVALSYDTQPAKITSVSHHASGQT